MNKKDRLKNWLKDPYNLALVGVLIFAFVIRFYYFVLTKNQPLWWDELAYGSLAKNFIFHTWDGTSIIIGETLIRPPLFSILWSFLIRFGIDEVGSRFLLEFVPSIFSVFFAYLIAKEIYNRRTALIATFIFSVLWIHLFYTGRLLTNVPALAFLFLSIYFFLKANKKDFSAKYFSVSLILLSLATLIRYPVGLVFFAYLIFLIIIKKLYLNKIKFWLAGIIGISPILLFFLVNLITQGNIFPALLSGGTGQAVSSSIAFFHVLSFIPVYLRTTFLIFFIIGLILALFELIIGYDIIKKNIKLMGHLLLILILIIIYFYFIFYIRGAEDRWLFPASLSLVFFAGFGINYVYDLIKKYNKYIGIIFILLILGFGAYSQITFADELIENKKVSFLQMRQGFEWIKLNTPEDSVILGGGIEPYTIYYAERKYETFPEDPSDIDNINADYLVVHVFTNQPDYVNSYLQNNQDKWQPINAFFFDQAQQQPALVIYQAV